MILWHFLFIACMAVHHVSGGPQNCKDFKEAVPFEAASDAIYRLSPLDPFAFGNPEYSAFCDMTTAGGGWTLVASVHKDNMNGECTARDRWTSQHSENWHNFRVFGTLQRATSDDYKNPGYYDIVAEDVAVWHVPNNSEIKDWKTKAILRYHTTDHFLKGNGENLFKLFKMYPVQYGPGNCGDNYGPFSHVTYDSPVTYDNVDDDTLGNVFTGPNASGELEPGYLSFRPFNVVLGGALALCFGSKPFDCNVEHFCIGGSFPEAYRNQCSDFSSFNGDGHGPGSGWSASEEMTWSTVLIFVR